MFGKEFLLVEKITQDAFQLVLETREAMARLTGFFPSVSAASRTTNRSFRAGLLRMYQSSRFLNSPISTNLASSVTPKARIGSIPTMERTLTRAVPGLPP